MAGLVVSASTGVLSSLLSKLSVLLGDQYSQRKGLRRDIELLSYELTNMNAALEKLADMENLDGPTKVWRDKVREMAYDIEDCIDIFMNNVGQEDDDKDGLFHKIARKIRELRAHYHLANMIRDVKARVEEQSKIRDRYRIDESVSVSRVMEVDPRLPALFEDAKRLVGIDGPREEIIKMLMEEGDSGSGQLKVVSIVGFGGLGKTTLVNQVYSRIKNEFQHTAFVTASRTPYLPKILKDILSGVGYGDMELKDDVQKLIEILRAHITNKRYLIIIDDLWNTNDWCNIKCAFVENYNGSRVLTTTRIQNVATTCCFPTQGYVYPMQPLDEHHSRKLFFKRLFDTEDGCPEQFREVSNALFFFDEISNALLWKCKGVPLAITSIASLLANQRMNVEIWEKTLNSMGSELDTNPTMEWMRHVLCLSYNDLSHELKTCLIYLGMYPEDHVICKDDLVTKWIAEGFIREKYGLELEEAAENCLIELMNRSMIQPCSDLDGNELWGCRVHDLMLDLIISKCKVENFITIIDRNFTMIGASQARRISHQFNHRDIGLAVERMGPSQFRSYNYITKFADGMPSLSKSELLRVLDMDQDHVFFFLISPQSKCLDLSAINHLFLLKYLRISGFRLELPKKFGKLKHLITINISDSELYPSNQSSDFTSLSSLRHPTLPEFEGSVELRNGLSKLCNLRTLLSFDIANNSVECMRELGELTNLRNLRVIDSRSGDMEENPDIIMTAMAASLDKLGNINLRSLKLCCEVESGAWALSAQFWSNCLTSPRNLQRLHFYGLIPKVPNWIAHAGRLMHARIRVQELWSDDIQVIAQLPCLVYLNLEAKTIPEKNIIVHSNTFPSLSYFSFVYAVSCLTFEPEAMPRLQTLMIVFDARGQGAMQQQETSTVGGIKNLASLEENFVSMIAERDDRSKLESSWRDAISRHPKSQAIKIHIETTEC